MATPCADRIKSNESHSRFVYLMRRYNIRRSFFMCFCELNYKCSIMLHWYVHLWEFCTMKRRVECKQFLNREPKYQKASKSSDHELRLITLVVYNGSVYYVEWQSLPLRRFQQIRCMKMIWSYSNIFISKFCCGYFTMGRFASSHLELRHLYHMVYMLQ